MLISRQIGIVTQVIAVLLVLLTFSSIFGGPLGIIARGERHVLLLVLLGVSCFELWRTGVSKSVQFVRSYPILLVPLFFVAINAFWVFYPLFRKSDTPLFLPFVDAQSLLVPLVLIVAFVAIRDHLSLLYGWARLAIWMSGALAAAHFLVWLYLLVFPVTNDTILEFERSVFGTNEGVNILRQWNNGIWYIRVVWISTYWFVATFFLAPAFIRKRAWLVGVQTLLGLGIIVSYTRGIWLAVVVGMLLLTVALIRSLRGRQISRILVFQPLLVSGAALILAVGIAMAVSSLTGEPSSLSARFSLSVFDTESDKLDSTADNVVNDEGASDRFKQAEKLFEMWRERPIFGYGYGAYAKDLVRHQDRPFLYEMVPFALLMKLGAVGFGLYLLFMLFVAYRVWCLIPTHPVAPALLSGFVSYILQVHTNPVFYSLTGMFIFSFLIMLWMLLEVVVKERNSDVIG
ncbi:O-antigen ligase family protein [Rhizobium sp. 1399]|uniref:O-antigen ligase family protein n=1 Tax=Rhizobium sp. 1399 TaxID=2817758 RepID=UPI002860794C|nr:O-antigen ligase family protein [Rhizobium sp. 1399]MDR6671377.1 hypothetical protein [Rhizobium sp. 1399]